MSNLFSICLRDCGKEMTYDKCVTDKNCNFCDIPYILIDLKKLDNSKELIQSSKDYNNIMENYKKNIRTFFKNYQGQDGFNGVINTIKIMVNIDSFPGPLTVELGWQQLPVNSIYDFCSIFDYYPPTVEFKETHDSYGGGVQYEQYYTFKKKKKR